jgi:shikimate dehydrogenase
LPATHAAITARTALCGILLHPAGHTRSPAIHASAYAALGFDAVYLAFDVAPERLADAIHGARALGVRQLAISLPHKQAVMALVDEVDETARQIGAVNTVTRVGEKLIGANTDWIGAVRALETHTRLEGARAVVLGAGGTARAVVFGLRVRGASVRVLNRSPERARRLADDLGAEAAGGLGELAQIPYDVLVNTTSVGLREDASPVDAAALRAGSIVMDAVYDPEATRLLRDAEARGARAVSGRFMLIHQAAEQVRLLTGREPPLAALEAGFDAAQG